MNYFPKTLCCISKKPSNVFCFSYQNWNNKSTIQVVPTFVTDAENKKSVETGKKWAQIQIYGSPRLVELPNLPMSNIQLVTFECRGNGGRAWKVIANGFYVDLREEELTDALLNEGCDHGILKGQFLWARIRSQMKLVRVGSELYQNIKDEEQKKSKK